MSTTPLFDAIARQSDAAGPAPTSPMTAGPAPTSPMSAPVPPTRSTFVPAALVAAIDEIPTAAVAAVQREHCFTAEQRALVEAVADVVTRAVVDAAVAEVDRILAAGVVRS